MKSLFFIGLELFLLSQSVLAQPIQPTNGLTTVSGGTTIWIDGGQPSNDNRTLLHDFTEFNVPAGYTAWFNSTSSPNVQNVLACVLGSNPSFINGILRSDANLFLVNPNGIIFGSGARLDVSGLFSASTATSVGFSTNDIIFYADTRGKPDNLLNIFLVSDSIILWDEVGSDLPSRGAIYNTPKKLLECLYQVRHEAQYLFVIAQSELQIDFALRNLVEEVFHCDGYRSY